MGFFSSLFELFGFSGDHDDDHVFDFLEEQQALQMQQQELEQQRELEQQQDWLTQQMEQHEGAATGLGSGMEPGMGRRPELGIGTGQPLCRR